MRNQVALFAASLSLVSSLARAAEPALPAASEAGKPVGIAVLEFASSPADKDKAKGLAGVVAARLASLKGAQVIGLDEIGAALGLERQKQALGCTEESCLQEISGALGVRYLVHGRLDRFGQTALLNAFLFDARSAKGLLRVSQKVEDDALLLAEAEKFALEAGAALGLAPKPGASVAPAGTPGASSPAGSAGAQPGATPPPSAGGAPTAVTAAPAGPAAPPFDPDFHLNIKLGNTLASLRGASTSTFNLRFDVEGDYYITPHWQIFLQLGIVIGSVSDTSGNSGGDTTQKTFTMVPAYLGAKHTFRAEQDLRPYLGLGLGLGFLNQVFSHDTGTKISLTGEAVMGLAYMPFTHVGVNAEASLNLSGVTTNGDGVSFGLTTNFGLIALF